MLFRICCLALLCTVASGVAAQKPPVPQLSTPMVSHQWSGRSTRVVLSNLVGAKMKLADEKPQLILMLKGVADLKPSRNYIIDNGTRKEETHKAVAPVKFTDNRQVPKTAGLVPQTIAAKEFQYYDLSGERLSIDEASKRLEKLTPVFLLDYFAGEVEAVPDIQRQALNPKCLIITSKKRLRGPKVNSNLPTY